MASDGKTLLLSLVRDEYKAMCDEAVTFVSTSSLDRVGPAHFDKYELVLIDGPSPGGDHAVLSLPWDWMEAIDGALLVVPKRRTPRALLAEIVEWLECVHIPVLGMVWNEHWAPPPLIKLYRLAWRLRHPFGGPRRQASGATT